MTPSKNTPYIFFQPNDPIFYGADRALYERGNYARKMPPSQAINSYVYFDLGDSVFYNIVDCETLVSVLGNPLTSIGGDVYKLLIYPSSYYNVNNKRYFIRLHGTLTGSPVYSPAYSSTASGSTMNLSTLFKSGVCYRVQKSGAIRSISVDMNFSSASSTTIQCDLYRHNPNNLNDFEIVDSTGYVNTVLGNVTTSFTFADSFRPVSPGDIYSFMFRIAAGPAIVYLHGSQRVDENVYMATMQTGNFEELAQMIPKGVITILDSVWGEAFEVSNDPMYSISYKNSKAFENIPANTIMTTTVRANFWQQQIPQEFENIEIAPGRFVQVMNTQNRTKKLETEFMPAYRHENLQMILGSDEVYIDGVQYLQRNPYTFNNSRHYGLSKGSIELTESNSVNRHTL